MWIRYGAGVQRLMRMHEDGLLDQGQTVTVTMAGHSCSAKLFFEDPRFQTAFRVVPLDVIPDAVYEKDGEIGFPFLSCWTTALSDELVQGASKYRVSGFRSFFVEHADGDGKRISLKTLFEDYYGETIGNKPKVASPKKRKSKKVQKASESDEDEQEEEEEAVQSDEPSFEANDDDEDQEVEVSGVEQQQQDSMDVGRDTEEDDEDDDDDRDVLANTVYLEQLNAIVASKKSDNWKATSREGRPVSDGTVACAMVVGESIATNNLPLPTLKVHSRGGIAMWWLERLHLVLFSSKIYLVTVMDSVMDEFCRELGNGIATDEIKESLICRVDEPAEAANHIQRLIELTQAQTAS